MKQYLHIHKRSGEQLPLKVKRCRSFFCRLKGLMFRLKLKPAEALLFEERRESIAATAIHMFFVFFPIAVIWIREDGTVVDSVLALPFRPYYAPSAPAKYFLEGPPFLMETITIGEKLTFTAFDSQPNG